MPDNRPRPRCQFCNAQMHVSAEAIAINRTPHFAHSPNSGFCPSKAPAGEPFVNLTPRDPDVAAGQELRRRFRQNWKLHYDQLRRMVPCLSVNEFLTLLEFAGQKRAWEYRGMAEEDIPYVFVVLADYPPRTGILKNGKPLRKFWFRFWYQATIRNIEQLWIDGPNDAVLFRVSLFPPSRENTFPNIERDVVTDPYPISTPRDFLLRPVPEVKPFVVEQVERWFANHPEFGDPRQA